MTFQNGLKAGNTITNTALARMFKCATQGGMRRSHRTNSLVIVSDHTKHIHQDRWVSSDLIHYTGMGLKGDQSLDYRQNKTLLETRTNGVEPYLFEVYDPGQYLFRGRVKLAGSPFKECRPDVDGKPRTVWVFPLQVVGADASFVVPEKLLASKQDRNRRWARHLSDQDLFAMVVHANRTPGAGHAGSLDGENSACVAEFARRRSNGVCQLCDRTAPFCNKMNEPYLELHHIRALGQGGADTIANTVALCPNCHKKMHVLNLSEDRKKLKREAHKNCCQLTIDGGITYI
ncbi:HNH endonuclease [uncultured Desulfosarcina sp.]|uniref:HNH endonuclease n=1 Tax=uncultured Desulfosarcina sp. TaxID=218289 RepID=UPI0029C7083D|nr:HNH endonuclease [uncultured Desulfosarcina sp.]